MQKQTTDSKQQQYILLTYRSEIKPILPTTYYNSDSGWGCMLRVGQMFLANLYYKNQQQDKLNVIKLFYDNAPTVFSIQKMTQVAAKLYPQKKKYDWFTPCQCGFILKQLIQPFDNKFRITICNDNCLFLNDIQADRDFLGIMLMCRIGLDSPQPEYLQCIIKFFEFKHFNSILGGTPSKAHLFLKQQKGQLGFLDPHKTQKVTKYQQLANKMDQYTSKLTWIKNEQIDSSMSIAFIVPKNQLQQFWAQIQSLKKELGEKFFLYIQRQRPIFDQNDEGIIQIVDGDDF